MTYLTNRRHSSNYAKTKSRWQASEFLRRRDSFGKEVPSFNVEGDSQVRTVIGGFMTLTILTVTLGYSITKFADLTEGNNPNINLKTIPNYYGPTDGLNLATETNFRLAVGMRWADYPDDVSLQYDPQAVRWLARLTSIEKGAPAYTDLPLHSCTEADYREFYPLRDKDRDTFDALVSGSSTFQCLDWSDQLALRPENL